MARLYSSFLGSITHKAEAMVTPRRKCRRPAIRLNPIHIPNQNTLSLRVGLKAAGHRRTAAGHHGMDISFAGDDSLARGLQLRVGSL